MNKDEFSVCVFYHDDRYEYVGPRFVLAEDAVRDAIQHCKSIAAKTGFVKRIIITDGGDSVVFEWKKKEGITWPLELKGRQP